MSKIIDFFKIIGAKSSGNVELSSEEIIENAADLTREQKKILLDSVREMNNAAKKIDIDSVVHTETRKGLAGIKNNKDTKYVTVKGNQKNGRDDDQELVK